MWTEELKLSWNRKECKPLTCGVRDGDLIMVLTRQAGAGGGGGGGGGRGLHSSTFQLNLSALYGIGGARRGCAAHAKGVCRVLYCARHGSS